MAIESVLAAYSWLFDARLNESLSTLKGSYQPNEPQIMMQVCSGIRGSPSSHPPDDSA